MKVLVVIGFLFIGYHVDARAIIGGDSETLYPDEEACISELHLNRDKIIDIYVTNPLPENDDEFTKFMGCTGKRTGLISHAGEVLYEEIVKGILEAVEDIPQFQAWMMPLFKQAATKAADSCHQHPTSDVDPGIVLIKAMNCIDKEVENL